MYSILWTTAFGQTVLVSITRDNCKLCLSIGSTSRVNSPTTSTKVQIRFLIANGNIEAIIKINHDISSRIQFSDQCAVHVLKVYPNRSQHLNGDGEFMEHCVGQILR